LRKSFLGERHQKIKTNNNQRSEEKRDLGGELKENGEVVPQPKPPQPNAHNQHRRKSSAFEITVAFFHFIENF